MQLDTAIRSAADVVSLGTADEGAALADALIGAGGPGGLMQRYEANLQRQRTRDAYDTVRRRPARAVGEVGGAALGFRTGSILGTKMSKNLTSRQKGRLGEALSNGMTFFRKDFPLRQQVRRDLSEGHTVADILTAGGKYIEAKFGPYASLRKRQRQALRELGSDYVVDRWMPYHVGRIAGTGLGAGSFGATAVRSNQQRP